jgi:hypothetical protein
VAQNFLTALAKTDFKNARLYCTPETGKVIDMLESFSTDMPDSIRQKAKEIKVSIKSVKPNGDKCEVVYTNSEKEEDQILYLEKKDGKWLVNMSKDESVEVSNEQIPAEAPLDESVPMSDTTQVNEIHLEKKP